MPAVARLDEPRPGGAGFFGVLHTDVAILDIDTLLNLSVLVFIGLLPWLYLRDEDGHGE